MSGFCEYSKIYGDTFACHNKGVIEVQDRDSHNRKVCILHAPQSIIKENVDEFVKTFVKSFARRGSIRLRYIFAPDNCPPIKIAHPNIEGFVDLSHCVFPNRLSFKGSTFLNSAIFHENLFGDISFRDCSFIKSADFHRLFVLKGDFMGITFGDDTDFNNCVFLPIKWEDGDDKLNLTFSGSTFDGRVTFTENRFWRRPNFEHCVFKSKVLFRSDFFDGVAFRRSIFEKPAEFSGFCALSTLLFLEVNFEGKTDFKNIRTKTNEQLNLIYTQDLLGAKSAGFITDDTVEELENVLAVKTGGVTLRDTNFDQPDLTTISGCGLDKWSFAGSNIDHINFKNETWPRSIRFLGFNIPLKESRKGLLKLIKGRKVIVEERTSRKRNAPNFTWKYTYDVYRALQKNFERDLKFYEAGDFHFGRMNARLHLREVPVGDKFVTILYRLVSSYGESLLKPWICIVIVFFVFSVFFYLLEPGDYLLSLKRSVISGISLPLNIGNNSGGAGFWAVVLGYIEKSAIYTLVTFFVLALRRRFKR